VGTNSLMCDSALNTGIRCNWSRKYWNIYLIVPLQVVLIPFKRTRALEYV
jgi:hypothetical protein